MKETKFKQTEVGMIPSDWEEKLLGEITDVRDGTHDSPKYYDIGYKFVTSKNLINGKIDFSNIQYISKIDFDKINERSKVDINDILFAMIGTIGNPVLITKEPDFAIKNVALFKDKRCTNQAYLKFYLSSALALNRMLDDAKGSNQKFIPLSYFRSFLVPLPPTIEEQQRIANALSDVDTLIANLEKLIDKKKNIKQGAMQQLLTGKKRLPGFGSDERTGSRPTDERRKECLSERSAKREVEESSGYKMTELGMIPTDWEVKTISQVGKIIGGGTPSTFNSAYWNGSVQWFTPAELSKAGKYVSKSERTITKLGVENCSAKILPAGTILLTTRASIGTSAILKAPACTNQGFQSLVVNSENSNEFLYYLLSTKVDEMMSLASGSTFLEISPKKLGGIQLQIPSSRAEQTAIANVLSDMDSEISALETKLAKYRKLKTGMMQQLLTGKIRLV